MGRILFVWADPRARVDSSVFTGSSSHVFNLIKSIRETGHQVTTIFPGEGAQEKRAKATFSHVKKRIPFAEVPVSFKERIGSSSMLGGRLKLFRYGLDGLVFIFEKWIPWAFNRIFSK